MKALWKLTWLEIKIFVREPMGLLGTVGMPVLIFLGLSRAFGGRVRPDAAPQAAAFLAVGLPVLAALLMAVSAVVSLVTVISVYREGGILKRLRATPLHPNAILGAQVLVKLLLTLVTLVLLVAAGRRYFAAGVDLRAVVFSIAVLYTTLAVLSMGFVIASLVPTARFAQPAAALVLYPMLALSGLFFPLAQLPPWPRRVAEHLPLTYAVSLLKGAWLREPLAGHVWDIVALAVVCAVCTALSAKVFRWE